MGRRPYTTSTLGDLDGDGLGDMAFGAGGESPYGKAHVLAGDTGWSGAYSSSDATWTLTGTSYYYFGFYTAGPGDMDGDGYDDLVLGCNSCGHLEFYSGSSAGPVFAADGQEPGLNKVTTAGDLDGDGWPDLLAYATNPSQDGSLGVYLFAGSPSWNPDPIASWVGVTVGDNLGAYGPQTVDTNGDGTLELLLSAPGVDGAVSDVGAVYLLSELGF